MAKVAKRFGCERCVVKGPVGKELFALRTKMKKLRREASGAVALLSDRVKGLQADVVRLTAENSLMQASLTALLFTRDHKRRTPEETAQKLAEEKARIENVLQVTAWNKQAAAEMLGLSRRTLYRRMGALGIAFGRRASKVREHV